MAKKKIRKPTAGGAARKKRPTKSIQRAGRKSSVKRKTRKKSKKEETADQPGVVVNVSGLGLPTVTRPFLVEFFPTPEQFEAEERVREEELALKRRQATKALKKVEKKWWKVPGVVGVNVAYRTKLDNIVSPLQIVIQVDVVVKKPVAQLKSKKQFVFPKEIDGVPVKVREIRYIKGDGAAISSALTSGGAGNPRSPAIKGGIQIAPTASPMAWGTLGLCVPHEESSGTTSLIGISNKHVVQATNNNVQNPAGATLPQNIFGTVLKSTLTALADAASIGRINDPANREFEPGIIDSDVPVSELRYLKDTILKTLKVKKVFKVGAATDKLEGTITNRRKSILVPDLYDNPFVNVIEAKGLANHAITDGGDSGSVLVSQPKNEDVWVVIGLNFAMSVDKKFTYAIPFGRVISKLKLKIPQELLWSGS